MELAYGFLGYGTALGSRELGYVGIGNGQTAYVGNIGVQKHAVDVACRYGLLVDNGADVQFACHGHVVHVFHLCYGFPDSQSLGGKACQYVVLRVAGQCHETLYVANALVYEQVGVAGIAMDNHYVAIVQLLHQLLAAVLVVLYDFQADVVGLGMCHVQGDIATAHNHGLAHVGIVLFAHYLADEGNVLACGHKVGYVAQEHFCVTVGDDGCLVALDCYDVEWRSGTAEVFQRFVEQVPCLLPQFYTHQAQCSAMHLPVLAHPGAFQSVNDFLGGKFFGVYQRVYAHLPEHLSVVLCSIFAVVHTCHRLLGTKGVCQHAACDVFCLLGSDGNEQVGVCHSGFFQTAYACGRNVHDEDVVVSVGQVLGLVRVLVHQDDVVVLLRKEFCKVCSHGTCTGDDYFHVWVG